MILSITMKTNHQIQMTAKQLQERLASPKFQIPIFTRFRIENGSIVLPVQSISIDSEGVTLLSSVNGKSVAISFFWEELKAIEALCDINRKPVFLHNFDEEEDAPKEIKREKETEYNRAVKETKEYTEMQAKYYDFAHGRTQEEPDAFDLTLRLDDSTLQEFDEEMAREHFRAAIEMFTGE